MKSTVNGLNCTEWVVYLRLEHEWLMNDETNDTNEDYERGVWNDTRECVNAMNISVDYWYWYWLAIGRNGMKEYYKR